MATTWLDDYSVPILTTIPASVNTFVPIFDASANALRAIIQRNTGILSDADAVTAKEVLKRMMDKTQKIQTEVESYAKVDEKGECSGKLITWKNNMRNTYQELNTGSANIQKLSSDLAAEIEKYNTTIRTLQAEINNYNTLIGVGAGLVGSGLFIGVVGSALCFAFPVVGGIGLALGIGMVIGGGVTWGSCSPRLTRLIRIFKICAIKKEGTNRFEQNQSFVQNRRENRFYDAALTPLRRSWCKRQNLYTL